MDFDPNLLCGFSVWLYWGMLAKFIQKAHFSNPELFNFTFMNDGAPFSGDAYRNLLFTLPAVAGLVGATLRIPNSFMIAICGGRNVKFMTTLLLMLPALGAGIALQNPDTPFFIYILLAALSGVGGGAFASSMSNISFFFPKAQQGLALGLNAGLGNLGVSVMQFLLPWIITFSAFRGLGGDPYQVGEQELWIQNAGIVWVPITGFLMVLAFLFMNNMPQHKSGPTLVAVGKYLWLTVLGFLAGGIGVFLLIIPWGRFPAAAQGVRDSRRGGGADAVVHEEDDPGGDPRPVGQAVRHLQQQTQLGDDLAVHDDLRLFHRLRQRLSQADRRCLRRGSGRSEERRVGERVYGSV